jgi:hypothetical protein
MLVLLDHQIFYVQERKDDEPEGDNFDKAFVKDFLQIQIGIETGAQKYHNDHRKNYILQLRAKFQLLLKFLQIRIARSRIKGQDSLLI